MTPPITDAPNADKENAEQLKSQDKHFLGHRLPKKIRPRHVVLADRLYDFIPPVCWLTEIHLAEALGTTTRQIRTAKAYLEATGRVRVELRENGRRANPIHTLIKPSPINHYNGDDGDAWRVDWTLLEDIGPTDLNELPNF